MPLDLAQKRLRVLSRRVKKVVDNTDTCDGTTLFRRGAVAAGAR